MIKRESDSFTILINIVRKANQYIRPPGTSLFVLLHFFSSSPFFLPLSPYPFPYNEILFSRCCCFMCCLGFWLQILFWAILNFWRDFWFFFVLSISYISHLSDKTLDRNKLWRISFSSLFFLPHEFRQDIIVLRTCSRGEMFLSWPSRGKKELTIGGTSEQYASSDLLSPTKFPEPPKTALWSGDQAF